MSILAGKHLFRFSLVFIYLINTTTLAQPVPRFISFYCENASTYTENSTYRRNLDTTLSTLPTTNSGLGFYNFSTGQGNDRVNSVALCRGDVNLDVCQRCVNDSIVRLRELCPNQKEAIGYYDNCLLQYSNEAILGKSRKKFYVPYNSTQISSDVDQFNSDLRPLMDELRVTAAAGSALRKFATGNTTGPDFSRIYALVQCTPDLSNDQCNDCLEDAINQIAISFNGRVGGRILLPMCNFRYEIYRFFNESTVPSPTIPRPSPGRKNNTTVITVSVIVTIITVIIIVSLCIFMRLRKKKKQTLPPPPSESIHTESETMDIGTAESLQYSFSTIKEATNDFSEDNKLGQGGFGAVYKGKLENGHEIAVKRLAPNSRQGNKEFKNEVSLLAKLQHRNLVRLLGFSIHGSERLLIYEFLPNGSLNQFIFHSTKRTLLDWEKRFNIIKGIAKGLLYLHEDSRLRIIHRDMKADNVLLDAEMNPKIADFGLAKLFKPEETQGVASRIAGTFGYMAPEYVMHRKLSRKSDVFSFGVLVLEMVTGQKNNCFRNGESIEDLLSFTWKSRRDGTTLDMIDPTLKAGSGSFLDINRSIHIGLLCVQENDNHRPTMDSVVHMLNSFSMTLPLPSEPPLCTDSSIDPEKPLLQEYSSSTGSGSYGI